MRKREVSSSLIPKRRDQSPLKSAVEPFTDVMIDLETLGNRPGCAILSIGAVEFGPQGLGRTFYVTVGKWSQIQLGLHESQSTLDWWKGQSPEARVVLEQSENDNDPKSIHTALLAFANWLSPTGLRTVKVWGNGSDFDNAILACCYAATGDAVPWQFWNNRCYRTLKNLRPEIKLERTGTYHNALDDAKTQARHAIQLLSSF